MSLISSKSKSSTTNTTNYDQVSATYGDLSSGNTTVGGDYYLGDGLSEATLKTVLENNTKLSETAFSNMQSSTTSAINSVSKAYGEAYNETRSTLTEIKPMVLYGVIGLIGYKLLGGRL